MKRNTNFLDRKTIVLIIVAIFFVNAFIFVVDSQIESTSGDQIFEKYDDIIIDTEEDILDQNKLAWIGFAMAEDLPHLIEGRHYKNLYKFVFEVPSEDKAALTETVKAASISLKG